MDIHIQEHISLKELTTLKIGGTARYFCSIAKAEELIEAFAFAREKSIGFAVLGGGSNTLIADGDLDVLVIKIDIKGVEWQENQEDILVIAGAGESWDGLVVEAVRRELRGIENLSGIPGTVGAVPIQNIGAYGTEIKETVEWVEVVDTKTGKLRRLSNKECAFGYRDSIFKHSKGKSFIVTRVALRLKKSGVPKLDYKDLKQIFNFQFSIFNEEQKKEKIKNLTPQDIRKVVLEIRAKKFPDLKEFGTAGSFFKNPIVSKEKFGELKKRYPELPGFPLDANRYPPAGGLNAIKLPLAWILDNICGLKGYCNGNVALFERQPIVLVNLGGASADEIKKFAEEIIVRIREKTGIIVEWEVQQIR